jgi:hypothetical protein
MRPSRVRSNKRYTGRGASDESCHRSTKTSALGSSPRRFEHTLPFSVVKSLLFPYRTVHVLLLASTSVARVGPRTTPEYCFKTSRVLVAQDSRRRSWHLYFSSALRPTRRPSEKKRVPRPAGVHAGEPGHAVGAAVQAKRARGRVERPPGRVTASSHPRTEDLVDHERLAALGAIRCPKALGPRSGNVLELLWYGTFFTLRCERRSACAHLRWAP